MVYSSIDFFDNFLLFGFAHLLQELVAISPERRNWRGIFIALLVIAAVFSLIIFSIFLLSPEDEGLRIRGRRMLPSDILSRSLQWKPFNGTWSNGGFGQAPHSGEHLMIIISCSHLLQITSSSIAIQRAVYPYSTWPIIQRVFL